MGNDKVFPQCVTGPSGGLTKRELFAAMAMQGILSNQGLISGLSVAEATEDQITRIINNVALTATVNADALIKELEK